MNFYHSNRERILQSFFALGLEFKRSDFAVSREGDEVEALLPWNLHKHDLASETVA